MLQEKEDEEETSISFINQICAIELNSVCIKNAEMNSKLTLSAGIYSGCNLKLLGGVIEAGYFSVSENIEIKGDVQVKLKESAHETLDDNLWWARVEASNMLIDLEEHGFVSVKDCSEYYTISVVELNLGANTQMVYPEHGHIVNEHYDDDIYSSDATIFNPDGSDAERTVFEYVGDYY